MIRKILILMCFPALAFGQSAQVNLSQFAHQLQPGGVVPLSALNAANNQTWTGVHTFKGGGGTGTSVSIGTTGAQGILCVGNSTCNSNATPGDPPHAIELVNNGGALQGIRLITYWSGAAVGSTLHFVHVNGTQSSPLPVLNGDNILSIGGRGWDGSETTQTSLALEGLATENWSTSHGGSKFQIQVTPTGTVAGARNTIMEFAASSSFNTPNVVTNGTGDTSRAIMQLVDTAGTRYGYWGKAANGDISYESDSQLSLVANNGVDRIGIGTGHVATVAVTGGTQFSAPSSAVTTLTVTGPPNAYAGEFDASTTTGQSDGLVIKGGTNTSDTSLTVRNATNAATLFNIDGAGTVTAPNIGTTASAANAFLDSATGNKLLRSTSSIRYKQDVHTLEEARAFEVLQLRPVRYRSKAPADDSKLWWYGLIAEEVGAVDPRLIFTDKEGRPDGVQYDRVGVLLLSVVQRQQRELHWLWTAVALLTSWNLCLTLRRSR